MYWGRRLCIRYVRNNGKDLVKRFEDGEARERVKVFSIKWCLFIQSKMPHSKLKVRSIWSDSAGMIKCPCSQTLKYESDRDES